MAATSASKRFRLDLTDFEDIIDSPNYHPLCWILINTLKVTHINQFKKEIRNRYNIPTVDDFSLYIDNAFIPENESMDILREGDFVKVATLCRGLSSSDKSKKRKASQDVQILDQPPSTSDAQEDLPEVLTNAKKSSSKKKRKKSSKKDVEVYIEDPQQSINNVKSEVSGESQIGKKSCVKDVDVDVQVEEPRQSVINVKSEVSGETQISFSNTKEEITLESDSFIEEITEPKQKRVRKRGKKNRKVKNETDGIFNSTPVIDLEDNPFKLDNLTMKLENGTAISKQKHIRFETPKALVDQEGEDFQDNHSFNKTNYLSSNETNSISQWPTMFSTPLVKVSGESCIRDKLIEMSKTRQINSKQENHSVILLNCENNEASLLNGSVDEPNGACNSTSRITPVPNSTPTKKNLFKSKNWTVLVGPPRVGDLIAYKVLELSQTYCPEVSGFKTAKVLGYEADNDTLKLEILSQETVPMSSGKFDIINDEDGEIKIPEETLVDVKWLDLIEPKLIS